MENSTSEVQNEYKYPVETRRKIFSFDEEWDVMADPYPEFGNPEDLLISRDEEKINEQVSAVIENVLQTLPEIQKSIITIRYFMDGEDRYTAQQLADILGISRKSYYNYLNSALAHLRCELERNVVIAKLISNMNSEEQ